MIFARFYLDYHFDYTVLAAYGFGKNFAKKGAIKKVTIEGHDKVFGKVATYGHDKAFKYTSLAGAGAAAGALGAHGAKQGLSAGAGAIGFKKGAAGFKKGFAAGGAAAGGSKIGGFAKGSGFKHGGSLAGTSAKKFGAAGLF